MPQTKASKHYYSFVAGLHTEVTPLTYPENSVTDISNIELKIDGSLRRRKGLTPETSAAFKAAGAAYTNGSHAVTTHFWRNAGGADNHIHIVQVGRQLFFYTDDPDTLVIRSEVIDISSYLAPGATVDVADVGQKEVDISWGRGQALVTQQYIQPFYLSYDLSSDTISSNATVIRVRDFVGIDDGTQDDFTPTTLTTEHSFNLRNAGWTTANINQYFTDKAVYPARNMRHEAAYVRAETTGNTYSEDGIQSFSSNRIEAEVFGNVAAPMGKFLSNPFDTTAAGGGTAINISTWSVTPAAGSETLTVTTASNHGYSVSDMVEISGQNAVAHYSVPGGGGEPPDEYDADWSFNGTYTISATPSATTFEITVNVPAFWDSWVLQFDSLGQTRVGFSNPLGTTTDLRPTTNAYFAGRAWYAGTPSLSLGQSVLFSQIIQRDDQYGKCYQVADPTDPYSPDLVESDGGQLFIPEAGRVIKLQPFGPSMLVMCDNGIWEIDGGGNRYFDAIDYSIRRVSEVGCVSRQSVVEANQTIIYAAEQGAYRIFVDPEARVLVSEPITEAKVNAKWVSIHPQHKKAIKSLYDPVLKRILWMYDTSASPTAPTWNYREVLVYDMRLDAFYVYNFPAATAFASDTYVKGFVKPDLYTRNGEAIIKYLTFTDSDGLKWNEMTEATFSDLGEVDAAGYLITGYESMGDASRDKQIDYMTTFMQRIPDSSLKMRVRWDFAESSITGKFTPEIECYRPPRAYIGDGQTQDDDGYPVVFSKHTVPGQGLVLQARFDTVAEKDCSLYGWSIDFKGIQ